MDDQIEHAPCGFLSFLDDGTIVEANATLCRWLGHEPGGLNRRPLETILTVGGRIFCQTHIFPLLKLQGAVEEIYFSLKLRAGGTLDVLTSASRRERAGAFVSDCVFLPMRQRRQYEDELLQAKKVADEATQAKAKFLSMMSHELRTPMNAILGFGQLLQMARLPPDHADSVQHILKAGGHLLNLINEVLDLSRIDAGRLDLRLEPVKVSEAIEDVSKMTGPLARQAGIDLGVVRGGGDGRRVLADGGRLRQVLLNLLANGIKYNRPAGGVRLWCEVIERPDAERLRFVVSDTGYGIAPEKLAQLFTPFERLGAESTSIEGTGLGLSLCKRLTEAMGGEIGVASTVGEGSQFWVELPLAAEPEPPPARTLLAGGTDGAAADGAGRQSTVLYIEDNASNRALVKGIFGFQPSLHLLLATSGESGVEAAREHLPDLVLLDLQLPDLPGDRVLERLRADSTTSQIPVIILSADATSEQKERLLQAGAEDYLVKPLDLKNFISVVHRVLSERASA